MFRIMSFFVLVLLLAGLPAVSAGVINVEFNEPTNPADFSGNAGAAPDALGTHFWNQFNLPTSFPTSFTTATSSALLESDGSTPTGVTVTISRTTGNGITAFTHGGYAGEFAEELLGQYGLYFSGDGGGSIDLSIDGLNPGSSYDIYVYAQGAGFGNYGASILMGGNTKETQPTLTNSFVEGDNYVLFPDVVATGGSILATISPQSTQLDEANFNGLQIVSVIPEPSTAVLAALGLLGPLGFARRRGK